MRLLVGTLDGYRLDSKGRLSIPTKWRDRLGKEFYMVAVTVKGCKCLTLYPVEYFEEIYMSMQHGTENQKYDAITVFFDNAEEATLDSQGRFTVNQRLKDEAMLSNDSSVVFKGKGQFIEIWNTDEYEKIYNSYDHSQGMYDLMDKLKGKED
ncbi:MAG: division/cell wall cluster transcriptional repressor MraZ [Eubacterium sp.]